MARGELENGYAGEYGQNTRVQVRLAQVWLGVAAHLAFV